MAPAGGETGDPSASTSETPGNDASGSRAKAVIGRAPACSPDIGGPQGLTSTSSWDLAGPASGLWRHPTITDLSQRVGRRNSSRPESASPPPHPPADTPAPAARDPECRGGGRRGRRRRRADPDGVGLSADMDLRQAFIRGPPLRAFPVRAATGVELRIHLDWCRNRSGPLV